MKNFAKQALVVIMLCCAAAILFVINLFIFYDSENVEITHYDVTSGNLPASFDGFKIVQLSDMHNAPYEINDKRIIGISHYEHPDMIAVTGDLADDVVKNKEKPIAFMSFAAEVAPCYYITGNHEREMEQKNYEDLMSKIAASGVNILHNETRVISKGKDSILLIGLDDPDFTSGITSGAKSDLPTKIIDEKLRGLHLPKDTYTLLLSHRPEAFHAYISNDIDLALSGHTHGGQIIFPFGLGSLYAPHQGFFPKYDYGVFTKGRTTMIISRGIGFSTLPFRINNNPEVVVITLHSAKSH